MPQRPAPTSAPCGGAALASGVGLVGCSPHGAGRDGPHGSDHADERVRVSERRTGVVSVVLVNYKGTDDTLTSIVGLTEQDWPADKLEIIVVDNDSGPEHVGRLKASDLPFTLVESGGNLGFAGGCNLGVANIHRRVRRLPQQRRTPRPALDPRGDRELRLEARHRRRRQQGPRLGGRTRRLHRLRDDLVRHGLQAATPGPDTGRRRRLETDVLFGTGSAMFVRARRSSSSSTASTSATSCSSRTSTSAGGSTCWAGGSLRAEVPGVPQAPRLDEQARRFRETYLLERNALFTLYKNLGEEQLCRRASRRPRRSPSVARSAAATSTPTAFDLRSRRRRRADDAGPEAARGRRVRASTSSSRTSRRCRVARGDPGVRASASDRELLAPVRQCRRTRLPRSSTTCAGTTSSSTRFGVARGPARVTACSSSPATRSARRWPAPRSAPGTWRERSRGEHDVRAREPDRARRRSTRTSTSCTSRPATPRQMVELEAWADVIVFQGHAIALFAVARDDREDPRRRHLRPDAPRAARAGRSDDPSSSGTAQVLDATDVLNDQLAARRLLPVRLRAAAPLLARAARRRSGRINPAHYSRDPDLRALIGVVPFGLSATAARAAPRRAQGRRARASARTTRCVVWSGGLYNWFDPMTLIRAIAELARRGDPTCGCSSWARSTRTPACPRWQSSRRRARSPAELGAHRSVFFNDSWVDYDERAELPARGRCRREHALLSTSRRRSRSAPASSTTSGRACRS